MTFAKLFETEGAGQVLVKLDVDEKGAPEVRWYAQPEGLGVCSFALGFEDNDTGWAHAKKTFNSADVRQAATLMKGMFDQFLPERPKAFDTCPKCGGAMKPGQALQSTFTGSADLPGGEAVTMSPGGPGKLVGCLKCTACGHSVTKGHR